MNPCEDCPLDDKIYECCGRFPETGATVGMVLEEGGTVSVCPHLTSKGTCGIYAQRPLHCRAHECIRPVSRYRFMGMPVPEE